MDESSQPRAFCSPGFVTEKHGRKQLLHLTTGRRLPEGCQDVSFIPVSFCWDCGIVTPKQDKAVSPQQTFCRTVTLPQLALSVLVLP